MIQELPLPTLSEGVLGGIEMLTDDALFEANGVRVAFTGRQGGVSAAPFASLNLSDRTGDDGGAVRENRLRVARAVGADGRRVVIPVQVHGTDIIHIANERDADRFCMRLDAGSCEADSLGAVPDAKAGGDCHPSREADIVLVEMQGVVALMQAADCLMIAVVSPSGRSVLAHAGWRGAFAHVARKATQALAACDSCPPDSFNAYMGPHIGVECYEVSDELAQRFAHEFGDDVIVHPRHLDLSRVVRRDLIAAGLDDARIVDACVCTKCHSDRYFSYRVSGEECGRHGVIAFRKEDDESAV